MTFDLEEFLDLINTANPGFISIGANSRHPVVVLVEPEINTFLTLIKHLQKEGAILRLFDPIAMTRAKEVIKDQKNLFWCKSEFDAAKGAHGIALLTEWKQFRHVDFSSILKQMEGSVLFDGRNQYNPAEMSERGFDYIGIGVPDIIRISPRK